MFKKNNFYGFVLGLSGYTIFVILDSIIKLNLVNKYPVLQINFYICVFAIIPTIAVLALTGNWIVLVNNKIHIQLFRGLLGITGGALVVNSFKHHSLTEIYPILFSAPLILTILSYFILKEKGWYTSMGGCLSRIYWGTYSLSTRNSTFYHSIIWFIYCSYYGSFKCYNYPQIC